MKVEVCFSPALFKSYFTHNNVTTIVVDVLRASSTICAALNNGANSIISVATLEEAETYKKNGYLVGAERNALRCEFADFGNSPFDYTTEKVKDKDIVFTTTNGTKSIAIAAESKNLIIGCFSNLKASVNYCIEQNQDVIVLCAGWNDKINIEDTLYGGAVAELLAKNKYEVTSCDGTRIALEMWQKAKHDIDAYVKDCEHYNRLANHQQFKSLDYCFKCDTVNKVPVYNHLAKKIILE